MLLVRLTHPDTATVVQTAQRNAQKYLDMGYVVDREWEADPPAPAVQAADPAEQAATFEGKRD